MAFIETTGKSVQDAIDKALKELKVSAEQVTVDILEEGKKGFLFGFGSKDAKVRVTVKEDVVPVEKPAEKSLEEATEEAKEALKNLTVAAADVMNKKAEEFKAEAAEKVEEIKTEAVAKAEVIKNEAAAKAEVIKNEAAAKAEVIKNEAAAKAEEIKIAAQAKAEELKAKLEEKEAEVKTEAEEFKKAEGKREPRKYAVSDESVAAAKEFLQKVFHAMKIEVVMEKFINKNDGTVTFKLHGDEMGIMIGKHGQTLDSLQYLTNLVANKNSSERVRVIIDVEDYRDRRVETLTRLARRLADKVKRTGERVELEAMNPHERKIIHMALQGDRRVTTLSEGDEPYRHVVIELKK